MSEQKNHTKKKQFTQPQKNRLPFIMGILVVLVAVTFLYLQSNTRGQIGGDFFGEPVASPRSYVGQFISMSPMDVVVAEGKIQISLDELDEHNIVNFEIANNEGFLVPLMAYITPSGRIFVGSSMCEPCGGRTFSLAGETLVCDTCRTTYAIENHKFLSGSSVCGSYPPVYMNPVLEGGMVVIELQEVLNWRIRA